jgi:hypothetical protein
MIALSYIFALVFPRNIADVGMIKISSDFALRRCLGVVNMISFFPDEVSKCIIIGIVSHFLSNALIYDIPFFYNDVSCIDDFVQLRVPEFILV